VATQWAMLVTRIGGMACAFPIEQVIEVMRPPPIEPLGRSDGALAAIDGVAMIRGTPTPVVDARRLLGLSPARAARIVIVRIADRSLGVLVDDVIGVQGIERDMLSPLPPLLHGANRDSVSAIGARDRELLVVLDAVRVLPEDSWQAIAPALARSRP
jgi:purine-binding chemotaxis protein CheW